MLEPRGEVGERCFQTDPGVRDVRLSQRSAFGALYLVGLIDVDRPHALNAVAHLEEGGVVRGETFIRVSFNPSCVGRGETY